MVYHLHPVSHPVAFSHQIQSLFPTLPHVFVFPHSYLALYVSQAYLVGKVCGTAAQSLSNVLNSLYLRHLARNAFLAEDAYKNERIT